MSHSIRVMRVPPQQPDIPFAFGTVRHALWNHLEKFCRDRLTAIVPCVRVAAHDRDRRRDRGSDQALRFCPLACSRSPHNTMPDPRQFRSFAPKLARSPCPQTARSNAIDRLESDA
ncbi:hypothetical protein CK218_15605 [Mesorhizobium sp. WSM3879]|nr:hypothetical protein CK218_15605 [Mesorhizobium sp. WSM3879]